MSTRQVVYWDSCVFIDWIQRDKSSRVALLEPIVLAAMANKVVIVTSALALAEVIRCNRPDPISERDEAKIVAFFKQPFISVRNLDRRVATESRRLSREALVAGKKLPPQDAVHIATALLHNVSVLQTFDEKHLIPFSNKFSKAGGPPLRIEIPSYVEPPAELGSAKQGRLEFTPDPDGPPSA